MNKSVLTLVLIFISSTLFAQVNPDLKDRINNKVNKQAKASKYELNLYETLFVYNDYIDELNNKTTNLDVEELKKLNTLSNTSSNELDNYKKTYKSLDLTTKIFRKKHYDIFVVDAESFLDNLNKQSDELKNTNNNSDNFAKKVSLFIHKYSTLIYFTYRQSLSLYDIREFSDYKENSLSLVKEYNTIKHTLKDEFRIADKSTGIIDHYSEKALYSEFFEEIENLKSNEALKTELERHINYYKYNFNTYYDNYHKQFPAYFIEQSNNINSFFVFYNDLGIISPKDITSEINTIITKTETLKNYVNSSEFVDFSIQKNSDLLNYTFVNEYNYKNPFQNYKYKKTEANPTLIEWLKKEESLFNANYLYYNIISLTPISNPFGRYRWGSWKSEDGNIIENAYAQKQTFIVTYKDLKSNKCYASNFTAHYLEHNNVLVSSDEINLIHTRLIKCEN